MRWTCIPSEGCWEVADQNGDNGEWQRWREAVKINSKSKNRQWRCCGREGVGAWRMYGNYKNSNISPQRSTYPGAVILTPGWLNCIVCVCGISFYHHHHHVVYLFYLLLLTCVHHFHFVLFLWWILIEKMFLIWYELCCAEIHNWIGTESEGEREGWQSNVTLIDPMVLSYVCIGLRGWWLIRLNSGIWFDNVIFNQTNIKFITFY